MADAFATENVTEELAWFAAALGYDELPVLVRRRVVQLVVDAVACALVALRAEGTREVAQISRALGGHGDSTAINGGTGFSLIGATLLNGYSITAAGWCDVYRPAHAHLTPPVVGSALAVAEERRITGRDLLAAVAVGLEVSCRLGRGMDIGALRRNGWHSPGVIGPIGSAAAVGRVLGLGRAEMRDAFGIAGSQASGTMAHWSTPTVKFHQGRAALSGLIGATLAQQGFRSGADVVGSSDGGILATYSTGGDPQRMTSSLGSEWELMQIGVRRWPAGAALQGIIDSVLALLGDSDLLAADIESAEVRLPTRAFAAHRHIEWNHTLEAQLSVRYIVGALIQRQRMSLELFRTEALHDPVISSFARTAVTVVEDTDLVPGEGSVRLRLRDARSVEHSYHLNGPLEPKLSDDLVVAKFRDAAEGIFAAEQIDMLLDGLTRFDEFDDVSGLIGELAGSHAVGMRSGR